MPKLLLVRMLHVRFRAGGQFPLVTETTRQALTAWLKLRGLRASDWLFPSRSRPGEHLRTRQDGRLVDEWVALIGLDPAGYGTHSLRRTKVALGRRLIRSEPDADGCEFDACEIVGRVLVVAGGYCSEVLDLVEEAFDEVAVAVQE